MFIAHTHVIELQFMALNTCDVHSIEAATVVILSYCSHTVVNCS